MATINSLQRPDNIAVGQNAGYTVPAGKVARVTITLSVAAAVSAIANVGVGAKPMALTAAANEATVQVVLPAGDVVSSTRTAASGNSTLRSAGNWETLVGTSICVLLINSSNANTIRATASGSTEGVSVSQMTLTGTADIGFVAEEYYE